VRPLNGLIDALEEAAPTVEPVLSELLKDAAREITGLREALKTMEDALKTMEGLVAELRRAAKQTTPEAGRSSRTADGAGLRAREERG
jgi:hypothetical protein